MLLIDALRAGGWPEYELGNALGIVAHEDPSGNPAQPSGYNVFGTEDSWGLFQINRKAHPQYSVAQLIDPVFNASVAYQLYQAAGNTYRDWSTAPGLGLPPYGSAHYSIEEFSSIANVDVGGGGIVGNGAPADRGLILALAVAGVALILWG